MYTIVGFDKNRTKKYASFSDIKIAEKQIKDATAYFDKYQKTGDSLLLRIANSILGESDLHSSPMQMYTIEN